VSKGYIKLYRLALEKPIFQNAELWQFATYCLLKATHKPVEQMVGRQVVKLTPGQFVMTVDSAVKELLSTPHKIRVCIKNLKKLEFVTNKTTNRYTLITVVNWDTYQGCEIEGAEKNANKQQTNNKQTTNKRVSTIYNKNIKNIKKERIKERKKKPAALKFSPPTGSDLKKSNPWLNATAWDEFIEHRNEKGARLNSMLGVTKNLNVLSSYNDADQQKVVDLTIANNWTGLFPLKNKTNHNKTDKTASTARLVRAIRLRKEQCECETETEQPALPDYCRWPK